MQVRNRWAELSQDEQQKILQLAYQHMKDGEQGAGRQQGRGAMRIAAAVMRIAVAAMRIAVAAMRIAAAAMAAPVATQALGSR
jgi:hypothetical protein